MPAQTTVEAVLAVAELDMLQFHGDESPTFCSSFGLPYIKALRMRPDLDIEYCAEQYAAAWGLLLDTYVPHSPGGTGQSFDWQRWPTGLPVRLIFGRRPYAGHGCRCDRAANPFWC